MKKAGLGIALLLLAMLSVMTAQALEIECVQSNALGGESEYYIMQATLDNGQKIYYLSKDEDGWGKMEDVNFDGYEDFVPTIVRGASNFISVFYLYNPNESQYEPLYGFDQGFCNYTLDPEKGYVVSSINDGYQYGETKVFKWLGNSLTLLRSATSANVHTVEYGDFGYTENWDFAHYEMMVYDYTEDQENGQVIYHQTYPNDDPRFEDHQKLFIEALWNGL